MMEIIVIGELILSDLLNNDDRNITIDTKLNTIPKIVTEKPLLQSLYLVDSKNCDKKVNIFIAFMVNTKNWWKQLTLYNLSIISCGNHERNLTVVVKFIHSLPKTMIEIAL